MKHLLTLLAATALALTACSGSSSSSPTAGPTRSLSPPPPSSSATPPPRPDPPPAARACYRLGYDAALAPTIGTAPVPCSGPHDAQTFFVGHFAAGLPVDGIRVHHLESTACPRRFASFVGGTLEDRRLSLLRTVWFTPTVDQAELGAHWFQCVAIALRGDQHLAALDLPVKGSLDRDASRSHYGLCATDQPGSADFQQRLCAVPHSWKALRTVTFPAGRYPGVDHVKAAGQAPCQDAARAVAADPLNYQWSYAWPTMAEWKAGQTYGICWAPA